MSKRNKIKIIKNYEFRGTYNISHSTKPPLGLIPKRIRQQERFLEICEAISRYYNAGEKIPIEWIKEYNELVTYCK